MRYKLYNRDVLDWADRYDKSKFHAMLCDPPYHLTTITKRFGKKDSAPAKYGSDGAFARISRGFMGQTWDGGDIAFDPDTWAALGAHLYPGAFGMAFSASRNWHRMAVAIEDAGFILHPTIFGWLNSQGLPKATKLKGQKAFEGHRYGLQALKPAVEPIIVFQKPYEGRPLDNITKTGAGALNIDAGRVPTDEPVTINRFKDGAKPWGKGAGHPFETIKTTQGRWPANFILMDDDAASKLDAQSGNTVSVKSKRGNGIGKGYHGSNKEHNTVRGFDDAGGASRFFFRVQEQVDKADPIYYCMKTSTRERNAGHIQNLHPTLKPIALSTYLAKLLLPPEEYSPRTILIPFSGVGSEMIGAALAGWDRIVGVEFDTENGYVDIARKRMEHWCKDLLE